MGKTRAYKHRLDKYYHLARSVGYRSRAAFKLIQLNQQYDFLSTANVAIDLCAAPGGWSQVCSKYMPVGASIVAIDLAPIKDIPRVITLQADITSPKTHAKIRKLINGQKADIVLNDGAPNVGAAWITDSLNQLDLCLASVKVSTLFLRKGGCFVTKVFRSEQYNSLLFVLGKFFDEVIPTKPKASRDSSAELFVFCRGYKAPEVIDPRILDPQYVFSDLDELNTTLPDVKLESIKTAYDFASCNVSDYLKAPKPLDILATANTLVFDDSPLSQAAASHPSTTKEIKELCKDLKVLGRADKKVLYKWRRTMREALVIGEEIQSVEQKDEEVDSDEEIQSTLNELKEKRKAVEKSDRKRKAKMREQLLKRLQKNLRSGSLSTDIADPATRMGKLEPIVQPIDENAAKTYEQIVEENLEFLAKDEMKKSDSDDEVGEQVAPVKFARHVTIEGDPNEKDAKVWFEQSIFDSDEEEENEEAPKGGSGSSEDDEEEEEAEEAPEEEKTEEKSDLKGQSSKEFTAEAYSLAKKLQSKKEKKELIDSSFSRYMKGDEEGLPSWFVDDEKKHNVGMIPVSRDDVAEWKQQMKDIDEVSTKRVIEARMRKRAKAITKMKTLQEKTDQVAEKEGLNERSKLRLMERIYEKGMNKMKPAPKVVVTQKRDEGKAFIPKKGTGKVKLVDKRMKKDLRAQKRNTDKTTKYPKKRKSKFIKRRK